MKYTKIKYQTVVDVTMTTRQKESTLILLTFSPRSLKLKFSILYIPRVVNIRNHGICTHLIPFDVLAQSESQYLQSLRSHQLSIFPQTVC